MLDFLTLKPEVFGLDISDLSLRIIKLKRRGDFLNLASFDEAEIQPGIIESGEIKNESVLVEIIKKAIAGVKGEKLKTKYITASLPEEKTFMQVIQLPKMEEGEAQKSVYFEAENYIPMPVEKAYVDSQIVYPLKNHLNHLDVLLAAVPKETVDSYLSVLKKSGLSPLVLESESQAVARALIKDGKSSEPVLLLDLGSSATTFIIFSGYSIRFTTSLLITPRKDNLGNLAEQIKKYLDYYQTHSAHEHLASSLDGRGVARIILCGSGANLKGLDDFLAQKLNLPVALGNPWVNILPHPLKEVPELSYGDSLKYTAALGLALRGMNYD
ncbi:MAG: pilus assembly protein PilM [Candidatus Nealsonbacteria bacterium]|nr:pilus assembly protein PilM [Candidatus Nealsonbacteria bacterium]